MASRENQGLQVALILFVMMTVVLMVTTYISTFEQLYLEGSRTLAMPKWLATGP